MEFKVRNVNAAFEQMFWVFKSLVAEGLQPEPSRNGPVLALPEPIILTYERPWERVLFHYGRDANPVFHLMESLWMLAGRRDVFFPAQFNSRIGQYSDDGDVFNAAYGHRWRRHFGRDQLLEVIEMLRADPHTRQAVLQMWDADDLLKSTRDKACNMSVVFDRRGGALNMTVFNRSNDLWWGALGANAVHFSILQEFVALALGVRVGVYRQVSNNMHLYLELYDAKRYLETPPRAELYDYYSTQEADHHPLMRIGNDPREWLMECERFCANPFDATQRYKNEFFAAVAHPVAMVGRIRRQRAGTGQRWAERIKAEDWRLATQEWIERREYQKAKVID